MARRFLNMFKPILRFLPEVAPPTKRRSLTERMAWTGAALIIYFMMCEVPLYGVHTTAPDVFFYLRVVVGSTRGTLMELGMLPIITAGLILDILVASGIIEFDPADPEDRALFTAACKTLCIIVYMLNALFIASYYSGFLMVLSPFCTPTSIRPDYKKAAVILVQLTAAGFVLILLDEMIQKGWGLGSGMSLFSLASIARNFFIKTFWPVPGRDGLPYGALLSGIQSVINGELRPLYDRGGEPTLLSLAITIAIFSVVICIYGTRVEIPIVYARFRGFRGRYPISLLYLGDLPVLFTVSLILHLNIIAQILWFLFNSTNENSWLNLLGCYKKTPHCYLKPIGGLVFYLMKPASFSEALHKPVNTIAYLLLFTLICGAFARLWLPISGCDPATVARQLVEAGLQVPGFRRSTEALTRLLERYIPPIAVLSGILVGILVAISDIFGSLIPGAQALTCWGIVYKYYQLLVRERWEEEHPSLARLLGLPVEEKKPPEEEKEKKREEIAIEEKGKTPEATSTGRERVAYAVSPQCLLRQTPKPIPVPYKIVSIEKKEQLQTISAELTHIQLKLREIENTIQILEGIDESTPIYKVVDGLLIRARRENVLQELRAKRNALLTRVELLRLLVRIREDQKSSKQDDEQKSISES